MKKYVVILFFLLWAAPVIAQWNPDTLMNMVIRQNPYPFFEITKSVPDGFGGFITAWTMLDAATTKLFAQRIDAGGMRKWDTLGVAVTVTNAAYPDLAPNPGSGGAILTWKDLRSGGEGIYVKRLLSESGAASWTPNEILVASGVNVFYPKIVEDGTGGAWVTWIRPDSIGNNHAWTQHIGSSGTSLLPGGMPIPVFPRDSSQVKGLQSLPDGTGGILVGMIYHIAGATNDTLVVKRINNVGTPLWSKPALTTIMSAGQYPFDMQVSNDGKVFVTAFVSPSGGWVALQKLSIATGDSAWANMINTGFTTPPQALRVVPDTIGGAYVILKGSTYLNVQHIDSTGALKAGNFGITFFNTTWVNGTATIDTVDVSKDGKGGVIVAWTDNRNGTNKHVYGQRIVGDSTRLWAINGAVIAAKPGTDQKNARVMHDGLGGMYATWLNTNDISAARLYSNGMLVGMGAPSVLGAERAGSGVKIIWNSYSHPKLRNYSVIRSASPGFAPPGVFVGATTNTWMVDYPTPVGIPVYYRVAAVDSLGIIGAYSAEVKAITLPYVQSFYDSLTSLPKALSDMGAAAIMDNIYVAGGKGVLAADTSVFKYSLGQRYLDGTWQPIQKLVYARNSHGVVELGGKIYAFGGKDSVAGGIDKIEEYDPAMNSWTAKSPMSVQPLNFGYAVANGALYVAGGSLTNGTVLNGMNAFDPGTNSWTAKANLPVALTGFGLGAAADGKLYAFGGLRPDSTINAKVFRYTPTGNIWDTLSTDMPTPRFSFGCVSYRGRIYLIGGRKNISFVDPPVKTVEVFDPNSQTWSYSDNLPQGITNFAAAAFGPGIIMAGGKNESYTARNRIDFLLPNPIFVEIGKKMKGKIGETIHVPININGDLTMDPIYSIEVGIAFNKNHAFFGGSNSVTIGTFGSQFDTVASNFKTGTNRDTLYLAMAKSTTITGAGKQLLADLNLQVTGTIYGEVDTLQVVRALMNEGKPLLFGFPGTVRVQPAYGSISNDRYGMVTAGDASLVLGYRVKLPGVVFDPFKLERANVSGNLGVTAYDASLILQYVVGLITSFPAESSNWRPAKVAPGAPLVIRTNMERGIPAKEILDITGAGKGSNGGQIIAVPVSIENINSLYSLEMELAFPGEQYEFLGARLGESLKGFYLEKNVKDGHLYVALANARPASAGGKMIELYFRQLNDTGDNIDLISMLVNEEDVSKFLPKSAKPDKFALSQNYPNPFNPTTQISYQLPEAAQVQLTIYNILGQEIRRLVNVKQNAGFYSMIWDGKNNAGIAVASGVYLYRLKAGSFVQSKKMIFLK